MTGRFCKAILNWNFALFSLKFIFVETTVSYSKFRLYMNRLYPIGIQNFEKLRKRGFVYVDKEPGSWRAFCVFLIEKAAKQTGRGVVILIDEYDKPLIQSLDNEELQSEYQTCVFATWMCGYAHCLYWLLIVLPWLIGNYVFGMVFDYIYCENMLWIPGIRHFILVYYLN